MSDSPRPADLDRRRVAACAEYFAWAGAQPEAGTTDDNPDVLAAAAQAATGQIQPELS